MNLLLDTHVWLWMLGSPESLSDKLADQLDDRDTTLYVSTISYWEIALLTERGRIDLGDLRAWIECAHREIPVTDLPITRSIALTSRELAIEHRDPADRFLAATALVHDLTLVTRDARLLAAADVPTLAA